MIHYNSHFCFGLALAFKRSNGSLDVLPKKQSYGSRERTPSSVTETRFLFIFSVTINKARIREYIYVQCLNLKRKLQTLCWIDAF